MNAIDWLNRRDAGFAALAIEEQARIAEFVVLWTYFEANFLATEASGRNILTFAERVIEAGGVAAQRLSPILAYFRERYISDGNFTHYFDHLLFRKSDYESVVKRVLRGTTGDSVDLLFASLLIVFRYRKNFFHGGKWTEGLRGHQRDLETALELLQAVMEVEPAAA